MTGDVNKEGKTRFLVESMLHLNFQNLFSVEKNIYIYTPAARLSLSLMVVEDFFWNLEIDNSGPLFDDRKII